MDFWSYPRTVDEEFAAEVRVFIEANYPADRLAQRFDREIDPEFNRAFKVWQEEHLAGATSGQIAAFRREADRFGIDVSGMNPTSMMVKVIEAVGTDEQKLDILPKLRNGEALCSLGYTEPESGSDVAAAKTRAVRDGDSWIINGHKMFTSHADISTHVFLLTRSDPEKPKHQGLTMFLVPLDSPGVEVRRVDTLGYHHTCMTYYTNVVVPDSARVGEVDGGWAVMRVALDIEHGAAARKSKRVSGAEPQDKEPPRLGTGSGPLADLISRAITWACETRLADGSRPVDDADNQERLGRMAVDAEINNLLARRPDRSSPGVGNGHKLFWSEAYLRASAECVDMAGMDGLLPYPEPGTAAGGWIEFAFRGAPVTTIAGGCSEVQRDVIAERRLGLPRARPRSQAPSNGTEKSQGAQA